MDIGKTVLSPCKDCKDRWINTETLERCHNTCKKYLAYKEKLEINRRLHNDERKVMDNIIETRRNWSKRKSIIKNEHIKKRQYKTL